MKYIFIFCILFCAGVLASGCHSSVSPNSNCDLSGTVVLVDTIGNPMSDASGIEVTVEGGSQTAVTDSLGYFTLRNIQDGSIPLVFSKTGFAELHDRGSVSAATHYGTYGPVSLFQISSISPNLVLRPFDGCFIRYNIRDTEVYSQITGSYLHFWIYDSLYQEHGLAQISSRILDAPNHSGRYSGAIRLYFSMKDSISPLDPGSYQFASALMNADASDGSATYDLYRDSLLHNGFVSDTRIYCAAFTSGTYTQYQSYIDHRTGKKIYTGFSPLHSPVRSFILP